MVAPIQFERAFDDLRRNVSQAKLRANRRNARQSTGPRTADGKSRSARNAVAHGIFCRAVLLPGEDEHRFDLTRQEFIRALNPQNEPQLALVDTMIAARWRLDRCLGTESDLIADTTYELSELNCEQRGGRKIDPAQDDPTPAGAIASLLREYNQPLERLSRIEQRLHGQFHRCLRDLHALKQHAKAYADEPESRYLGECITVTQSANRAASAAVPTAPSPGTPGEGNAAAHSHRVGELQNEPTAEKSVVSAPFAMTCDDTPRQLGDADATTDASATSDLAPHHPTDYHPGDK